MSQERPEPQKFIDFVTPNTTYPEMLTFVSGFATEEDYKLLGEGAPKLLLEALLSSVECPFSQFDSESFAIVVDPQVWKKFATNKYSMEGIFPEPERVARLLDFAIDQGVVSLLGRGDYLFVSPEVQAKFSNH